MRLPILKLQNFLRFSRNEKFKKLDVSAALVAAFIGVNTKIKNKSRDFYAINFEGVRTWYCMVLQTRRLLTCACLMLSRLPIANINYKIHYYFN